jgi:hypothetical protein
MSTEAAAKEEVWPSLPLEEWKDTYATLHMWTQIVGHVRLSLTPLENHWWNVPLYVSARGLTTSPIPYRHNWFQIDFDFIDHKLVIATNEGKTKEFQLAPQTVADFYQKVMSGLAELGIEVKIHSKPDEVPDPIPFAEDRTHKSYDANYANRFWRIIGQVEKVFKEFRSEFIGKCSPVHFFWGSFDLAVTRFSGRRAAERPGADPITREAYSHEVISAGFWPGSGPITEASFYCYAAPPPAGLENAKIKPEAAYYHKELGEFLLSYEAVRVAESPEQTLMDFLQSTYAAAANLANWDRAELERPGKP